MHVSLALDSSDIPYVSYYDSAESALMYGYRTSGGWVTDVVDNSEAVGRHSSIALDQADHPHISYRDFTKNDLKYASWDGSQWNIAPVGSGEYGWNPSLALDANDRPHISYLGNETGTGSQTPKYAHWNGTQWDLAVIDNVFTSGGTSLALDQAGNPHVSYHVAGELRYAVFTSTQWLTETVDSQAISGTLVGYYSAIALDEMDTAHFSYAAYGQDFSPPFPDDLKYAVGQSGTWQLAPVDTVGGVGFFSDIALDASHQAHISYYDSDNQAIKYARQDGMDWTAEFVDSPVSTDGYTSIAIDQEGLPHIAYCDGVSQTIKYAHLVYRNFYPLIQMSSTTR